MYFNLQGSRMEAKIERCCSASFIQDAKCRSLVPIIVKMQPLLSHRVPLFPMSLISISTHSYTELLHTYQTVKP